MKLTANQKRALRHLWKGELTRSEIAEEMTASSQRAGDCEVVEWTLETVAIAAATLGLPEREDPDVYIPTREQIRLATARIRRGWSQAEREARICAAWSARMNDATERDNHAGGSASGR